MSTTDGEDPPTISDGSPRRAILGLAVKRVSKLSKEREIEKKDIALDKSDERSEVNKRTVFGILCRCRKDGSLGVEEPP